MADVGPPLPLQTEVIDGIQYACYAPYFDVHSLTADELWDMFDVRWTALSESRLDKGIEAFLIRDSIDNAPTTVQVAALNEDGRAIGGLRVHISTVQLLDGLPGVQISRVGVSCEYRGQGVGHHLVSKAFRIAHVLAAELDLELIFLLGRVLEGQDRDRVLRFYERIGFQRTNLFTETKGLSNCLMLACVHEPPRRFLERHGFIVTEQRIPGAQRPVLAIAMPDEPRVQASERRSISPPGVISFALLRAR